jgi:hypothetical protein
MLAEITRASVLAAAAEFEKAGRDFVLAYYGYGHTTEYDAVINGELVPAKAVVGLAHRYEHGGPWLLPSEFSGGVEHSARLLLRLGFPVWRAGELLTEDAIPLRMSLRPCAAPLRLYVCRATSKSSVDACHKHNFGTLLSPLSTRVISKKDEPRRVKLDDMSGYSKPVHGLPYVLDNGVWSCHEAGVRWSDEPFLRLVARFVDRDFKPEFVVAPDKIAAGNESLDFSLSWLAEKRSALGDLPCLLAVQDGMTVERVREVLLEQQLAGIFVGGTAGKGTPNWKWKSLHEWAELGLELGLRVHVGRVNGQRRAQLCSDLGVTSIDGSMISRYAEKKADLMGKPCDGSEPVFDPPGPASARRMINERRFRLALGSRE